MRPLPLATTSGTLILSFDPSEGQGSLYLCQTSAHREQRVGVSSSSLHALVHQLQGVLDAMDTPEDIPVPRLRDQVRPGTQPTSDDTARVPSVDTYHGAINPDTDTAIGWYRGWRVFVTARPFTGAHFFPRSLAGPPYTGTVLSHGLEPFGELVGRLDRLVASVLSVHLIRAGAICLSTEDAHEYTVLRTLRPELDVFSPDFPILPSTIRRHDGILDAGSPPPHDTMVPPAPPQQRYHPSGRPIPGDDA